MRRKILERILLQLKGKRLKRATVLFSRLRYGHKVCRSPGDSGKAHSQGHLSFLATKMERLMWWSIFNGFAKKRKGCGTPNIDDMFRRKARGAGYHPKATVA